MAPYRVQLESYDGPLDLLLFLIRREEVDIYDIPIARITAQYISYVDLLKMLDPDGMADYLVLLATLIEIKSRTLLPRVLDDGGDEDDLDDPRMDLVRSLLEYKRFKDAARQLGQAADDQSLRFPSHPVQIDRQPDELEIEDVQIWDLMTAFNRLMAEIGRADPVHEVVYDDTPLALHAADVVDRLQRDGGSLSFERIFLGRTKNEIIGLFLALLELVRQKRVRAEQQGLFGMIVIHLIDETPLEEVRDESPEEEATREEPAEDEAVVEEESGDKEGRIGLEDDELDAESDAELDAIDQTLDQISDRLEEDRVRRRTADEVATAPTDEKGKEE